MTNFRPRNTSSDVELTMAPLWVGTMPLIVAAHAAHRGKAGGKMLSVDNGTRPCEQSGKMGMGQRCRTGYRRSQTAITTARAWPGRLPPRALSAPTCRRAPNTITPCECSRRVRCRGVRRQPANAASRRQRTRLSRSRAEAGRRDLSAVPGTFSAYATSDRTVAADPAVAERRREELAKRFSVTGR